MKFLKSKKDDLYYMKPVQLMGGNMILDFHCVYRGVAFAIEAKAPNKNPTARQLNTIKWLERSGCKVFVVRTDGDLEEVAKWVASHS